GARCPGRAAHRRSRRPRPARRVPPRAGAGAQRQSREPGGEGGSVSRGRLMDIFAIHLLNALLYASVLFLIAGGLSLIYGVMRIVNLAHGNLYAFGAYVSAWAVGRVTALAMGEGAAATGTAPTALLLLVLPA